MSRYLAHEMKMHHWIQLPLKKLQEMEETEAIQKGLGYRYCDSNGCEMVELHVNDHPAFLDEVLEMTKFGGHLSI